jgi:hypothetical protein
LPRRSWRGGHEGFGDAQIDAARAAEDEDVPAGEVEGEIHDDSLIRFDSEQIVLDCQPAVGAVHDSFETSWLGRSNRNPCLRRNSRMIALWSRSPSPCDTMSANKPSTRPSNGSSSPRLRREGQCSARVLDLIFRRAPRTEVTGDHALAVLTQDGGVGKAAQQRLRTWPGSAPPRSANSKASATAAIVLAHHHLVHQLGELARSDRPNPHRAAHGFQERSRSFENVHVAACHDRQLAGLRAFFSPRTGASR